MGKFPGTQSLFSATTPITGAAKAVSGTTTTVAPLAAAAAISPIADIGSFALGLSDALAADKGFSFNLCCFTLKLGDEVGQIEPQSQPIVSEGPVFFRVVTGTPGERGGVRSVVELGIRQIVNGKDLMGVVELRKLDGFDTAIGDNLAVEVVAQELVPAGVVLVVKGFINPSGIGYAHFVGAVLVRAVDNRTFTTEGLFMTQVPSGQTGVGIFGKVMFSFAGETDLTVHAYRAPM